MARLGVKSVLKCFFSFFLHFIPSYFFFFLHFYPASRTPLEEHLHHLMQMSIFRWRKHQLEMKHEFCLYGHLIHLPQTLIMTGNSVHFCCTVAINFTLWWMHPLLGPVFQCQWSAFLFAPSLSFSPFIFTISARCWASHRVSRGEKEMIQLTDLGIEALVTC